MASKAARKAHVVLGAEIFWDQEAPEDDYPESFDCRVCGATIDWPGCCSNACYQVWKAPPEDDREYPRPW